jgi:hypothetical protein
MAAPDVLDWPYDCWYIWAFEKAKRPRWFIGGSQRRQFAFDVRALGFEVFNPRADCGAIFHKVIFSFLSLWRGLWRACNVCYNKVTARARAIRTFEKAAPQVCRPQGRFFRSNTVKTSCLFGTKKQVDMPS